MNKKKRKIIKKISIITLPIWGIILANILSSLHLPHFCIIKWLTSHECIGCGLTRAFAALGRFDFQTAYNYNKNIVFYAPLLLIIWIFMIYTEFKNSKKDV